jgi:translation initiation factor 5
MADKEIITPYVIPLSSQKPKLLTLVPSDPGSRYKTRQLQVQIVGKSKMMKTMLVNILDVAKDMQVPPSYVGTFMGYEIGAQAKWDPKKPERQQAFLSGEHNTKDLSKIALQFIQEVILCPRCGLPEIVTEITNDNKVHGRCRACGGFEELKISNEKFKRYILNHPPTTKGGSFSGNKNVDKKEAAVKNKVAKAEKAEKEEKEAQEKPLKKESREDEPVVWYSDTSEEAARARREQMLPDSLLKPKKVPAVAEVKDLLESPDKLQELKNSSGLSDAEFVPILFEALVPKESTNLSALTKQKAIIHKFVEGTEAQISLLRSIEKFAGEVQTSLLPKVSHIIKELYDEELLEEEGVFAWANDTANAIGKVREQAAPIVKWLKEAEEESGSDEGEDD